MKVTRDKISEWGAIRIRKEVVDAVNNFLESEDGEKLGFSSASQLAEFVLRNYLQNPDPSQQIKELEKKLLIETAEYTRQQIKSIQLQQKIKKFERNNNIITQLQKSQKEHEKHAIEMVAQLDEMKKDIADIRTKKMIIQKGVSGISESRAQVKAIKSKKIPNSI